MARRWWDEIVRPRRPRWLGPIGATALAVAVVGAYALASLTPFEYEPPRRVANGAQIRGDRISFPSPGLAHSRGAPAWLAAARAGERLDLSLRLRALAPDQHGPAQILALGRNAVDLSLALSQQDDALLVRLRTGSTEGPWRRKRAMTTVPVAGVLATDRWVDLALTVVPGELRLGLDAGPERRFALPEQLFAHWDPAHRLALGNELSGSHPWLGEIEQLVVRAPGAIQTYPTGASLLLPAHFWIVDPEPKLQPLKYMKPSDARNNLLLYMPLGLLLGWLWRGAGWRGVLGGLLAITAVSATMELAQLFSPRRHPSINDLILNVAGGGLAIAVVHYFQPLRALVARWRS